MASDGLRFTFLEIFEGILFLTAVCGVILPRVGLLVWDKSDNRIEVFLVMLDRPDSEVIFRISSGRIRRKVLPRRALMLVGSGGIDFKLTSRLSTSACISIDLRRATPASNAFAKRFGVLLLTLKKPSAILIM